MTPEAPILEVRNLSKHFGNVRAVDDISFAVRGGEIVGYLGPNGAGKSTTIRLIVAMLQPTSGTAVVAGHDVLQNPLEVKRRIGYVPDSGALYESLSPYEFLQMVGRLHDLADEKIDERIDHYLTMFKLRDQIFQRMHSFSKGMKQKVVMTAALLHDPEILILDEPLNGLDVHTTLQVKDLINELAARGKAVFFSSHLLDVVERLCDRVIILDRGKVLIDDSMEAVLRRAKDASLEQIFRTLTSPP